MKATRSARLAAAVIPSLRALKTASDYLRRPSSSKLMIAIVAVSTAMAAALDFTTSADFIGSILFVLPLSLCALQPSKKLLWGTAAAAGLLTITAHFWGLGGLRSSTSWNDVINRGLFVVSLFTLATFIHLFLRRTRIGALSTQEIARQRNSLASQNEQLELLVAAATRDLGVLKAAEGHLLEMEARYRGLLEAAPDAMVVVNERGEIVLLNLQAEERFGYPRDELVGQPVKNIIPEGFAERLIADDARSAAAALAQQIGTGLELIGRRRDGSEFPIELMLSPLENAEGILVTAAIRDISVRKDAEEHLVEMEARYRGLLEAAPDAMVVVNERGEIVLLNLQAEERFGYRRDELVGQPVKNIIPEGFAERLIADDARSAAAALAQQIGTGLELIGQRKDGSEFPIELMLSPLENAEGILVTAAIRDISVRKDAEGHLVEMEARYRGLLEAAPDAMVVVNERGEIVLLNLQAEKRFGYPRDELVGQPVKNIIPEGFAERLIADDARSAAEALAQQIGTGLELIGRRKDGSEFPIELMLSPLENAEGILVTAAVRDVTARHADHLALRASEEWHRMAVEVTQMGTWSWNIENDEFSWSDQARKIAGLTSDQVCTGQTFLQIAHPDDRSGLAQSVRNAIELGTGYDVECRIIWPDGSVRWIAARGGARHSPEGLVVGLRGTIFDLTERKAAQEAVKQQEALERSAAELTRSNDDLRQFAYVAAHDLQEPLRMVSSYTQLLSKRYRASLDADADTYIDIVVDGAQRMQRLISDLLAYCQVGTSGHDLRETSAEDALSRALINLQGAIDESGGAVTHGPLPTLLADPAQLTQLFQNVVGNAIKYRSAEPPNIHVTAKKTRSGEWVFSMRDNGLGIDPRYFDKIFLMFQRLHGRTEFSGTGIGLSLCKKIAERHGGRMWLESAPGAGSTFYLALPQVGRQLLASQHG